jgi:hypothetical protein
MKVKFFYPRIFSGTVYPKGIHTVPDSLAQDQYFKILEKTGDVAALPTEAPAPKAPEPESEKAKAPSQPQKK